MKNYFRPEKELIAMEKELFGMYLSNHPATSYKAKYNNIISLDRIPENFDKKINCVVLVDKIKTINTKTGEKMMFFDASDEYMKRDFTMFPKTYKEYSNLKVGDIIKIEGRVERRYSEYQIVVQNLEKLN